MNTPTPSKQVSQIAQDLLEQDKWLSLWLLLLVVAMVKLF
jgi:hypothetical protein